MKKSTTLKGLTLVLAIAAINLSFMCGKKITVYHQTNGVWQIIQIDKNSKNYHASHGDLWQSTLCPLAGDEHACN